MSSAQIIYGNSGGAIFLKDTGEFIGVPSMIAVTGYMGMSAITHMGFFIPIFRVYNFLEDNVFQFIYDNTYTSAQCERIRESKRTNEEIKMFKKETR